MFQASCLPVQTQTCRRTVCSLSPFFVFDSQSDLVIKVYVNMEFCILGGGCFVVVFIFFILFIFGKEESIAM